MIFVSTACYKENSSVKHVLEKYAKSGIKNIELGSVHRYEKGILDFLRNYKKKYKVEFIIHGYFPPEKKPFVVNLASQNPEILRRSIDHVKGMIKISKELDARMCSFHAGFLADPVKIGRPFNPKIKPFDYEKSYESFLSSVAEICRYAYRNGIKIGMEPNVVSNYNMVQGKNIFLMMCEVEEIKRFYEDLSDLGIKNLGIVLDLGHLKVTSNNLKLDAEKFIRGVKNKILEIHVHDNDGFFDQHKPLKKGSLILRILNKGLHEDSVITLEAGGLSLKDIQDQLKLLKVK